MHPFPARPFDSLSCEVCLRSTWEPRARFEDRDELRAEAEKAGWRDIDGETWCPGCLEEYADLERRFPGTLDDTAAAIILPLHPCRTPEAH